MNSGSIRLVSGIGGKGPACFLLETAGRRLMLDLGEGPPSGLLPNIDGVGRIDALVVSHGHKDHVGGLSLLPQLGNPPVYATEIVGRGLPDGHELRPLPVAGLGEVLGIEVRTGRNGHAPGGVWLHFAIAGGFLYTGDWSAESILYAFDKPPAAAVALMDCSYADYDKSIADCWNAFVPYLARGPLLLPVPANGRGPEIALSLFRHGCRDLFVDQAMQSALERLCADAGISLCPGIGKELAQVAGTASPIVEPRGVMLAASADGTSGATARLLADWQRSAAPAIVLTGYVPSDTPAERLIENGRAQFVRWNVHPRRRDLVALVRALDAGTVIPAFCDRSRLPSLAKALAPARVTMDGPVDF
jgi:Cft2 family RNA processing exonuclease